MVNYLPPPGYRIPNQPFGRFGYDGNSWLPASNGPKPGILPAGSGVKFFNFAALAIGAGLGVVGYYRADQGVSGVAGSGSALMKNLSGADSDIIPDGAATNGIGTLGLGLNSRPSLIQNGATQKGKYTAPALALPGTTNFHKYYLAYQPTGAGAPRGVLQETGGAYDVYLSTATLLNLTGTGIAAQAITQDVWQRTRISWTGGAGSEVKIGSAVAQTGVGSNVAVPNVNRFFGDLLCTFRWLMYIELTGPKANFLTFAGLADAVTQTEWSNAIQI